MISSWWRIALRFLLWSLALASLRIVSAANVTVDDGDTSIIYSGNGWNIGNTCTGCDAQPDALLAHGNTWHDTTRGNSSTPAIFFQYTFTGTEFYVYGIIVDIIETTFLFTTNVDLILQIDGGENFTYQHAPTGSTTAPYEYDVNVFAIHGLSDETHNAQVSLNPNSMFLFDYLIYSTSETSSTSSATLTSASQSSQSSLSDGPSIAISQPVGQPTHTNDSSNNSTLSGGGIAGIVIGILAIGLLLALLIGFLCYRQRKRQKNVDVSLPMGPHSHSATEPLVPAGAVPYTQNYANPSTSSVPGATAGARADAVGDNDRFTARGYEIPASFNSPRGAAAAAPTADLSSVVTNSALNSKQRMQQASLQPAQRYGGGGGGGGGGESTGDDLSSHTGPVSSTSSSGGRGRPYGARYGIGSPASLYPHGVPVPLAATAAPDYTSESGYIPTDTESSGHNEGLPMSSGSGNVHMRRQSAAQSSIFTDRPPTAPPPYPRSPAPLGDVPPLPNLAPIEEHITKR